MGANLAGPKNTPVLWPSVLTGIKCGFLFFFSFARRCLNACFCSCRELCMRPDRFSQHSSTQMQILGRETQRYCMRVDLGLLSDDLGSADMHQLQ